MGLPGDTNLELLHYIGSTGMHWGETANSAEKDVSLNKIRSGKFKRA